MQAFVCQLQHLVGLNATERARLLAALADLPDDEEREIWLADQEDGSRLFMRLAMPLAWEDCLGGTYDAQGIRIGDVRTALAAGE